jgi:uncharacterized membrane protein YfcA
VGACDSARSNYSLNKMAVWNVVVGCVCIYVSSTLSSAAGVGGGSLNVPILMNIFGFSYKKAVVLSLCTLMGNYLLQVLINIERRHPTSPTKPLIYWDAVLLLLPSELGGSNLGVLLSNVFPDTLDYILALIVLVIAGVYSLGKAFHLYQDETMHMLQHNDNEISPLLTNHDDDKAIKEEGKIRSKHADVLTLWPQYLTCRKTDVDDDTEIADKKRRMEVPWTVIGVIIGVWVFYAVCYVIMKTFSTCSVGYDIILSIIYLTLLCELWWGVRHLMRTQRMEPETIAEGDIVWTPHTLWLCPLAFLIGIMTAILGIGGGELFGPLMLKMDVRTD